MFEIRSTSNTYIPVIGSSMSMYGAGSSLTTLADNSQWLLSGTAISYSSKYREAAQCEHLKTYAPTATATGNIADYKYKQIGCNGTGIVLATLGSTTQYRRSTNGGFTWSLISEFYSGFNIGGHIWAGNRFIQLEWSNTSMVFHHSTTGVQASWTLGSTITGLTDLGANTLVPRMAYNSGTGTVMLCRPGATTTEIAYRCTSGSTFTPITMPNGSIYSCSIATNNIGRWIIYDDWGNNIYYSDNDGVTWSLASSPGLGGSGYTNARGAIYYINGTWIIARSTTSYGGHYISSTGIDGWRAARLGGYATAQVIDMLSGTYSADNTKLIVTSPSSIAWTRDGIFWSINWLIPTNSGGANWSWNVIDSGSSGMYFFNNYTATNDYGMYRSTSFSNPEYIGHYPAVSMQDYGGTLAYRIL